MESSTPAGGGKETPAVKQAQKVIKVTVGLLELAKQLGNVSQACRVTGYSRDSFYRFRGRWCMNRKTP